MVTTTHSRPRRAAVAAGMAVAGLLVGGVAGCSSDGSDSVTADRSTATTANPAPSSTSAPAVEASAELSPAEVAGLTFMVEEEKLAHDVYVTLGQTWSLPMFTNIAASETTHMAAVSALLDRYAIGDPTDGAAVGVFRDPALAALYEQLIAQGTSSETEALRVGALIEETDIVDLRARTEETDEAAIVAVYANLEAGSGNHLRAFTGALDARGVTYEPVRLGRAAYDALLSASSGRGRVG